MPSAEFEKWWDRFRRRRQPEEPHETARRLRRKLRRVKVADRPAFVARLFDLLLRRDRAFGIVLFVLEGLSDPAHLRSVAIGLSPLPGLQSDDEESHLSDLIRILAAANRADLMEPVGAYLLDRPLSPHWPSVPWALWPHRKEMFGRAWRRYLIERDADEWKGTLIIKSFLAEPDAIRVVRGELAHGAEERWCELREALMRQAGLVSWLSPDQRDALSRAIS